MTITKKISVPFVLSLLLMALNASADCLSDEQIKKLVDGYPGAPVTGLSSISSLQEAYCSQDKYVSLLKATMGEVVGYKVGFTGEATQRRFNIPSPAYGVLLDKMFIGNSGEIDRNFGYRTIIEPDFLVVVKSDAIMQATSARETLPHLATIHPFMELIAMQLAESEKITGNKLVAINVAATRMVMGEGIPVQDTQVFYDQLGQLQTEFTDERGELIQREPTSNLLGHPLNVVYWLVQEFNKSGKKLKAGDRLSLGAVGKLFPLKEGEKQYTYKVIGAEDISASVSVTIK